jgi:hypothetical protein
MQIHFAGGQRIQSNPLNPRMYSKGFTGAKKVGFSTALNY